MLENEGNARKLLSFALAMVITLFGGTQSVARNYDPGLFAANILISRQVANEGMVLLRNNGALPLKGSEEVAVFGIAAKNSQRGGSGSGDVNVRADDIVMITDGFIRAGVNVNMTLKAIYDTYAANRTAEVPIETFENLVNIADFSSTAIYVIGRTSGEGNDRRLVGGDYYLSDAELGVLTTLKQSYAQLIVILNVGGVIDTNWIDDIEPDAVLLAGLPGHCMGDAVADIVTGKVNPSGKLTATYAYKYTDYPSSANFGQVTTGNIADLPKGMTANAGYFAMISADGLSSTWAPMPAVAYVDDIYVGYRYFETFDVPVRYEFGFGLSYTTFSVTGARSYIDGENVVTEATVNNTGSVPGKEVVQFYVSAPDGTIEKPGRELKGFAKTDIIPPGQSQTIAITVKLSDLASYNEELVAWVLDKGTYVFYTGTSVKKVVKSGEYSVDALTITEQLKNRIPERVSIPRLSKSDTKEEIQAKLSGPFMLPQPADPRGVLVPHYPGQVYFETGLPTKEQWLEMSPVFAPDAANFARNQPDFATRDDKGFKLLDVYNGVVSMDAFVAQLSAADLTELLHGAGRGAGVTVQTDATQADLVITAGAAGHSRKIDTFGIPHVALPDGPAGVRITLGPSESTNQQTRVCTQFAQAALIASTWNTDLMELIGKAMGSELAYYGCSILLTPGMNIQRDPLNGRNFEYFSEDPLLTGLSASALTKGVQSVGGVGTTLKHYFANNQETDRRIMDTVLSERASREIYLRGYEIAIKESRPVGLMTAYNKVNGQSVNQDSNLLINILRDEWGFKGITMPDWGGDYEDRLMCDPTLTVPAGLDWIMPECNPGKLVSLQNICYFDRASALARVKVILEYLMTSRRFTELNDLPVHEYVPGEPTILVSRSEFFETSASGND